MGRLSAGYPDYVSLSMCMLQDCMTAAALMVVAILSYCRSEGIMNIYVGGGIQTERARHGEDWLGGSVSPTLFPVPAEKSRLEAVANSALGHRTRSRAPLASRSTCCCWLGYGARDGTACKRLFALGCVLTLVAPCSSYGKLMLCLGPQDGAAAAVAQCW